MKYAEAVWLYGSEARRDATPSSDVDLLLVGEGHVPREVSRRYCGRRISISRYGWEELRGMANYGSLFLHHLKSESEPLYESPEAAGRVHAILEGLPRYQRVHRDIRAFWQSLLDIADELPEPADLRFELATLAALIRRVGILGSYLLGRPRFDRTGPVTQVVEVWTLPPVLSLEFAEFYQHRLVADGLDCVSPAPDPRVLALWIERAGLLLDRLEAQADEADCRLRH